MEGQTTVMQNQMNDGIKTITKEVLGESEGKRHFDKETRSEVQKFKKLFERIDTATKYGKGLKIYKKKNPMKSIR